MKHIVVLGSGLVGKAIAMDLAGHYNVTAVDRDPERLAEMDDLDNLTTIYTDLSLTSQVASVIMDADIVVNALPGFMGYRTLEAIIKAGKNVVDISFFPENALELDGLAKQYNVTAIVDCGVAPGLGNLLLGHHHEEMQVDRFECYVGGLPIERTWPFEYKAPFSPVDVIEEYTRPARLVENGKLVERRALSEPEIMHFDGIGDLEAFNTDGLRSLLHTMSIPNMKEKTLRYPGHIELMKIFRETGLFDSKPVTVGDAEISPLALTTKLLLPKWKLRKGEAEFTVMKVLIGGEKDSAPREIEYYLYDEYDTATATHSMARTTGYTCNAAVTVLAEGLYRNKGIIPPEYLGKETAVFDRMLAYLRERNINLQKRVNQ